MYEDKTIEERMKELRIKLNPPEPPIEEKVVLKGMEAVCTANALKYLCRWHKKNGVEDLRKAKWYIEYLINMKGENE